MSAQSNISPSGRDSPVRPFLPKPGETRQLSAPGGHRPVHFKRRFAKCRYPQSRRCDKMGNRVTATSGDSPIAEYRRRKTSTPVRHVPSGRRPWISSINSAMVFE